MAQVSNSSSKLRSAVQALYHAWQWELTAKHSHRTQAHDMHQATGASTYRAALCHTWLKVEKMMPMKPASSCWYEAWVRTSTWLGRTVM